MEFADINNSIQNSTIIEIPAYEVLLYHTHLVYSLSIKYSVKCAPMGVLLYCSAFKSLNGELSVDNDDQYYPTLVPGLISFS